MLQKDKIGHFVISLIGTAFLSGLSLTFFNIPTLAGAGIGLAMMLIIGGLWETQGVFSWWDLLADLIGCIAGAIFIMLMWQ